MPEGIEAQTHQILRNLERVLTAAGCSLNNVVKVIAHLVDLVRDRAGFNAAYNEHFHEPLPAPTTVGSQLGGILVEVDVIAVSNGGARDRHRPRRRTTLLRHPGWGQGPGARAFGDPSRHPRIPGGRLPGAANRGADRLQAG
ncbi:MAG: RidA family protein [Candidatus Dormibacteraeota bacterium]|uniref:RidA family protein n=1 Tax=Candidatus Dormiibacter inghamiae TaxID=3127013 RepID=A0A934NGY6_9BACT|nr:RidA family protein [Candidatus Dormibacteraeota bacterium]MBJ7605224.1 RidA family protein [Candidatus Dormibacteraeota bacterium]